jgi:electron transfer flavoprotein alpha subunit
MALPKAFDAPAPDPSRRGEAVFHQPDLDPQSLPTRLLERVRAEAPGVRLEDARVVVGGGRGLGGPEPFALLEELAGLLGGAVGASRAACAAGWVPHSYQVGLTGKSIGAELYITVGISGASQHLAGISGVKNLVAVDRDEGANIFREARYGVVGSWEKVLPSFLEAVRELVRS